jgi:hypothetical protein
MGTHPISGRLFFAIVRVVLDEIALERLAPHASRLPLSNASEPDLETHVRDPAP